eukprot:maker-scaffold20_size707684-snap-gene-6.18 protein:Tk03864 transcript:maker-scaffold20_size707684-snap-gene-6.18-mRNA-1 annotation:"mitochondrial ornithine transporter"
MSVAEAGVDFLAGCAGGVAVVLVGQPMDTVKVKMQTFPLQNPDMVATFRKTLRHEGWRRGLYAGTLPSIAANVSELSVLFMGYGQCQNLVANLLGSGKSKEHLSPLENAFAGSLAAVFASFTLCPTEHIKCQLQAQREMSKVGRPALSMLALTRQIIRQDGIGQLFRGLVPTLAREIPGCFFFFLGNEGSKALICSASDCQREDLGLLSTLFCGGMAGVSFWVSIFPFDAVKSRIQVSSSQTSAMKIVADIWSARGIRGFYSGLLPCALRAFPSSAAMFLAYESSKDLMTSLWLT